MSDHALAAKICRMIRDKRLARIGQAAPDTLDVFLNMPDEEVRNWLDMAEVVHELLGQAEPMLRLRGLADDWDRYTEVLDRDHEWRDMMRRAVLVEMQTVIDRLWEQVK